MNWKPTPEDKRKLRAAAAEAAKLKPTQIALQPVLRCPVGMSLRPEEVSFNDAMWGEFVETDLYDNGFTMKDFEQHGGAPMNRDGIALVDFYVYQLGNYGLGIEPVELVGNVIARIETIDGKPRMVGTQ
jgi:hypothetical protein